MTNIPAHKLAGDLEFLTLARGRRVHLSKSTPSAFGAFGDSNLG